VERRYYKGGDIDMSKYKWDMYCGKTLIFVFVMNLRSCVSLSSCYVHPSLWFIVCPLFLLREEHFPSSFKFE